MEVSAGDERAGRGRGIYSGSLLWAEVGGGCIILLQAAALGMAPSYSYAPLCALITTLLPSLFRPKDGTSFLLCSHRGCFTVPNLKHTSVSSPSLSSLQLPSWSVPPVSCPEPGAQV